MALFKISKGLKANLPSAKTAGYCWYTTDDSLFYIDYEDENGVVQRKALNAKDAETLTGASLATILNSSDVEIPTSKAVLTALSDFATNDSVASVKDELQANIDGKADLGHTHKVSNITDLTATATELNYMDGVTSNVQTQLDKKPGKITTGTVYTINGESVTAGYGAEIFNNYYQNKASGSYSHAEGQGTTASGSYSHAEGNGTTASAPYSHAQGLNTTASGNHGSHAEGHGTTASGQASHAEGLNTIASGHYCHAEGTGTIAAGSSQHVEGTYNIEHKGIRILHVVGNGNSDTDRSDAHTLDWEGNAWFAGNVYIGGSGQDDGVALASTRSVTTAEYQTMSANNTLKETTLYMLTDDTEEEDLQNTVNEMNNIDYDAFLAFDTSEIV